MDGQSFDLMTCILKQDESKRCNIDEVLGNKIFQEYKTDAEDTFNGDEGNRVNNNVNNVVVEEEIKVDNVVNKNMIKGVKDLKLDNKNDKNNNIDKINENNDKILPISKINKTSRPIDSDPENKPRPELEDNSASVSNSTEDKDDAHHTHNLNIINNINNIKSTSITALNTIPQPSQPDDEI